MDYIQFITLLGTMVTGFGFMYKEFKSFEKDIREDIRIQSARSDKLYENFCDLLKLKRDP
jgi:hypothetical protein